MGFLSLAWQTYNDFKRRQVDSRRNWFMYGAVLMVVLAEGVFFPVYLVAVLGTLVFTFGIKKMFADGDLEALRWVIPGFFVLNWLFGLVYLASFAFLTLVYVVSRRMLKIRGNTAGYSIISGAFVVTAVLALGF